MANQTGKIQNVAIIGAGFSGMTLAYYLVKSGYHIEIFEREKIGGLIQTHQHDGYRVETAANAFLWTQALQDVCDDIGVELEFVGPEAKKRFIWWNRPRTWPLGFFSTLKGVLRILPKIFFTKKSVKPTPQESISEWVSRNLSNKFLERLVGPALQGVYAGEPRIMSARLILNPFFNRKLKSKRKGSCAPKNGMGEFFSKLKNHLEKQGVRFIEKDVTATDIRSFALNGKVVVIATPPWIAADLLKEIDPTLSSAISKLDILPVVRVTVSLATPKNKINGFGILFPRKTKFRSLGVLSDSQIFPTSGQAYTESWIIGGAQDRSVVELSDEQIRDLIIKDRENLYGVVEHFENVHITRWPSAFAHYNLDLEKSLPLRSSSKNILLTGNYLGQLGLTKILDFNKQLALDLSQGSNA